METHFMQSAYALRICIADTYRGSVRMEMYTNAGHVTQTWFLSSDLLLNTDF